MNFRNALIIVQGSHGLEKSWSLTIHFPGLEKSWILGKMAEVMENLVQIFQCLKTGSSLLVIEQKYVPKRLGFQHFLVMEKSFLFPNFCVNLVFVNKVS